MPSSGVIAAHGAGPRPSERGFRALVMGTILAAAATSALAVSQGDWIAPADLTAFWALAALCVLGELLPIRLARIPACDLVTMSTAFAFAILIAFGPLPAMAVYGGASVLADLRNRTGLIKGAFNVSHYILAVAAAGAVMGTLGHRPSVGLDGTDGYALLAGAAAFFGVNHLLAGTAAAILTEHRIRSYLTADLGFHVGTTGTQLALAPLALLAAGLHVLLATVVLLPLAVIYFSGRRAVASGRLSSPLDAALVTTGLRTGPDRGPRT